MTNKPTENNSKLKSALLKSHRASQTSDSPITDQVGGNWYKKLKIQPLEYCMNNNLNACQTKVIKNKDKKTKKQDIDKAIHCLNMLKDFIDKDVV